MALIALTTYITEENQKSQYLEKTLISLMSTVNWSKHRLFVVDNTEEQSAKSIVSKYKIANYISSGGNIGTAEGINRAWRHRSKGENCIKMDDDVVIHRAGWVDEMEDAITRDSDIGIIGLKRKDLAERPDNPNEWFKSELIMLPKEGYQPWIVVEKVAHVMGTVQMYSSALLEKMGYLKQFEMYGFDDALAGWRCKKAGFYSCFLPHYEIDHIDPGQTPYQKKKEAQATKHFQAYQDYVRKLMNGQVPVFYEPDWNNQPIYKL